MHNACMRTLQIRELPQPLYDLLSFKAQQHHRSLTQQTIAELEQALQPQGQGQGIRRLQTLHKLRAQAPQQPMHLGDQLERWQREDRDR
jgi:plasmid stability protein